MSAQTGGGTGAESGDSSSTPASRAGRNLPMAIAVGVGLGAVCIASLLIYRPSFIVIVAAAVVAIDEWTDNGRGGLCRPAKREGPR